MLIISHRGNTTGPDPAKENNPDHILKVAEKYDCEVDVWMLKDKFFLGHDKPQYSIDQSFLDNPRLWYHAKNIDALYYMIQQPNIKSFFHNVDDHTLTSNGVIWTFPGCKLTNKSIIVDLSKNWREKNYICLGVCVDYIL